MDIDVNTLSFFVAVIIFLVSRPYATRVTIKIISNRRLKSRIKKASSNLAQIYDSHEKEEKMEEEDIGLSSKGPIFKNVIFSLIAEKNHKLIDEMHELLLKAGLRQDDAMERFMNLKFVSIVAVFCMTFLIMTANDLDDLPFVCPLASLILGFLGGHKLTNMNLMLMAKRRKLAIENGVPDLIDLLVICTESGLDLNRSIRRIARELRTSNPILAEELSLTSIELEMIPDHKQVFTNLENRTDCLQIKTLSKTLSQSIEYGSSLSVTLRDLAVESRQKRMLDAEAKAAQAPTLMTLPMMFFTLPCLFIVMLGPVIVGMIKSFGNG
jgi:tight adherence protein C